MSLPDSRRISALSLPNSRRKIIHCHCLMAGGNNTLSLPNGRRI
jgi:hypothetical protein